MAAKQIIEQIDRLSETEQSEVYNLCEKDAQEYINDVRSNDRF